jgi:hypothetical protein
LAGTDWGDPDRVEDPADHPVVLVPQFQATLIAKTDRYRHVAYLVWGCLVLRSILMPFAAKRLPPIPRNPFPDPSV